MVRANQPNPFRRYEGASLLHLSRLRPEEAPLSPSYEHICLPDAVPGAPVTVRTLSRLFEYALALSAWKQAGGALGAASQSFERQPPPHRGLPAGRRAAVAPAQSGLAQSRSMALLSRREVLLAR